MLKLEVLSKKVLITFFVSFNIESRYRWCWNSKLKTQETRTDPALCIRPEPGSRTVAVSVTADKHGFSPISLNWVLVLKINLQLSLSVNYKQFYSIWIFKQFSYSIVINKRLMIEFYAFGSNNWYKQRLLCNEEQIGLIICETELVSN